MNDKNNQVTTWVAVGLGVSGLLCCGFLVVVGAIFLLRGTTSGTSGPLGVTPAGTTPFAITITNTPIPVASPTRPPTASPAPPPTDIAPDEATATAPAGTPSSQLDQNQAEILATVEQNVVIIRDLQPLAEIQLTLLTREQLRQRVEEDLLADFSEADARDFTLVLNAFDFVGRDFDYYNFSLDLYTEQIAGYYDSETDEFVVISDDQELDTLELWTHAHEYTHALQDQHYDLDILDSEELDSEASTALRALAEGDATLVQTLYLLNGYFTFEQMSEIFAGVETTESPVFDNAPPVLRNNLLFPYNEGVLFVQALYDSGGFQAVDEAWANPPQSTEQIIHPDRYLSDDLPQIVALAPLTNTLGVGWQQLDQDIFGEFFLRQYLLQQLADAEVETAATGWGGDQYAVYWNESQQEMVMTLRLAWDSPQDGDEFAAAYTNYATALYGSAGQSQADGPFCWQGSDVLCLYRLGDNSFIVRAPTLALAALIVAAN